MLDRIKSLFSSADIDTNVDQNDPLKLAAAVLMIEVLAADDVIDKREVEHTMQLLQSRFDIATADANRLFDHARTKADESVSLHSFTREICDQYDNQQRLELLSLLWEVALIDEELDRHERHVIRKIGGLLYLTDKQIIQARERAKTALS